MRNHPDYQRPYTGITALKTGEVAYDAASYLAESEQKSCAIAAGCFVTVSVVLLLFAARKCLPPRLSSVRRSDQPP